MNEFIIVLFIVVGLVLAVAFLVSRHDSRKTARKAQQALDKRIEEDLLEIFKGRRAISTLVKHSDQSRIARLVVGRILEYLEFGVSPWSLSVLFERLGLDNSGKLTDEEALLVIKIKQLLHEAIDDFCLNRYYRTATLDAKEGFGKLNKSFLVENVRKNGFVMDLQLSRS